MAEESDQQFAQRMKKKAAQPPTKGMSQKEKEDKGRALDLKRKVFRIAPLPLVEANYPDGFDLQISSTFGKTNFIRITPEQLSKIEDVLLGVV